MRLLLVTPRLDDNSTGRALVLWNLARALNWECDVVSFDGQSMWGPAVGTEFATFTQLIRRRTTFGRRRALKGIVEKYELIVSVKPLKGSFHVVEPVCRRASVPFMVDIDDPDLEARLNRDSVFERVAWRVKNWSYWRRARRLVNNPSAFSVSVSNPELEAKYGGTIVPHARTDRGTGSPHGCHGGSIAFVGTVRQHKGVDDLRTAVEQLASENFSLTVTDQEPLDVKPWERWVGVGTLDQGLSVVANADIVVIASRDSKSSRGQLPAKLVDGLMLGRTLIVSDIAPLPWAVGEAGLVYDGSVEDLVMKLRSVADPTKRSALESRARQLFLDRYDVQVCKVQFELACRAAAQR